MFVYPKMGLEARNVICKRRGLAGCCARRFWSVGSTWCLPSLPAQPQVGSPWLVKLFLTGTDVGAGLVRHR